MALRASIRWLPPIALTSEEKWIASKLKRTGRLFLFLRQHRSGIFDEEFQARLAEMYVDAARGQPPHPPALLATVTILQAYTGASDAEAVHLALFDRRWQMVLDCMGATEAPYSQGLLAEFRFRMIATNMDRDLIRRTVEYAKQTGDFGYKQLRVALDSAPIWGSGRVEDTLNLIGHAVMVCLAHAADELGTTTQEIVDAAGLQIVGKSSIKAALDIDWDDPGSRQKALPRLLADVAAWRLHAAKLLGERQQCTPHLEALRQLQRIIGQDTEPDRPKPPDPTADEKPADGATNAASAKENPEIKPPSDAVAPAPALFCDHVREVSKFVVERRIREGVAPDRQISISDSEMRHGRKSKSRVVNGYKAHVAQELDEEMLLDAIALPANQPEHVAADMLRPSIEAYGHINELHIDRGYLASRWVSDRYRAGLRVLSKPWNPSNEGRFPKSAFDIDINAGTVKCPGGETVSIPAPRGPDGARQVQFKTCGACPKREECTTNARGRSINVHANEGLLQDLTRLRRDPDGRAQLRDRVAIEHALAHAVVYQPKKARYAGTRKNTFGIRRSAAIINLQAIDRRVAASMANT